MRDTLVKIILFLMAGSILPGCVAKQPLSPLLQHEADTPLYCTSGQECKEMWERATYYVKAHSGFKLQIHNDSVIETYNPSEGSTRMAFSITREPLGNGKYQVWTNARCGNIFGCDVDPLEAIARAKYYMRTGQKLDGI